jgi:hypothetical protein
MIVASIETLCSENPEWQRHWQSFKQAESLPALVCTVLQLGLLFARLVLEAELTERAQALTQWPECTQCGHRLNSKGFCARQMTTLIGVIR